MGIWLSIVSLCDPKIFSAVLLYILLCQPSASVVPPRQGFVSARYRNDTD